MHSTAQIFFDSHFFQHSLFGTSFRHYLLLNKASLCGFERVGSGTVKPFSLLFQFLRRVAGGVRAPEVSVHIEVIAGVVLHNRILFSEYELIEF